MKISIANLSEGIHTFHLNAEPIDLGLGENFTDPVFVDVTLDKTGKQVFLKAKVSTSARFLCDRCVDEFRQDLRALYQMVYLYDESDAVKFEREEVCLITQGATLIDITDDVRQYLLLALPLKLLCDEECGGLCPHCGKKRSCGDCRCSGEDIDPRWESLKKLLKE